MGENENKAVDEKLKINETIGEDGSESKSMGITSMVLGIVGAVMFFLPHIAIICSILAIIFGAVGLKRKGKGMAIAGLILGIATLSLYVIVIIGLVGFVSFATGSVCSVM